MKRRARSAIFVCVAQILSPRPGLQRDGKGELSQALLAQPAATCAAVHSSLHRFLEGDKVGAETGLLSLLETVEIPDLGPSSSGWCRIHRLHCPYLTFRPVPHCSLILCPAPDGHPLEAQEAGLPSKYRIIGRRIEQTINLILDLQHPCGASIDEEPEDKPDYCAGYNCTETDPEDVPPTRPFSCHQRCRNCSEPHKLEPRTRARHYLSAY
jgi:hypothetical protein